MERGKLFICSRFFVRLGIGRWAAGIPRPAGPAVYVCSHNNLQGPLATLCWLPFPVRPWVFHMFLNREDCRRQYRDYTFSKRFGMPRPAAALAAWAASGYVSALMRSMGAIPVYRGTVRIGTTFKETVAALQKGDCILIFPDVDYTDSSEGIGEVYDGFLLLERFWRKVSAETLQFVPLRLDIASRRIIQGKPASFDRAAPWRTEMIRVREALRREINGEENN
ncbi:MAG: hypothetical protein K2O45_03450 [Oscillospiraceae bacterium]|nr:hypothetical protein [Oscillospiraceae bacterium]